MSHVMCSWSEPKEKSNKKTATTFLLAHYVKTIAHFACPCTICIIFSFFLKCGWVHIHFDFECQIRKKMTLEFSKFALFYLYRLFLSFLRAKIDWWPAILTSDDFIRSNEIIRTKWLIYVVIGYFVLTI